MRLPRAAGRQAWLSTVLLVLLQCVVLPPTPALSALAEQALKGATIS